MAVEDPDSSIVVGVMWEDKNRSVRSRCSGGGSESVEARDRGDPVKGRLEDMFRILS